MRLNTNKLAAAVLSKRTKDGLTFRDIQKQTKGALPAASLYRIEAGQGDGVSVDRFLQVCDWLKTEPNHFFTK